MANVKISEMTAATLPLDGDELLEVVQDGVSKQAPASAFGGASSLKIAFASIGADGAIADGSQNVDEVVVGSFGIYTINVGSAGFSLPPVPVACWRNVLAGDTTGPVISARALSASLIEVQSTQNDAATFERDFQLICVGL